MTVEEAWRWFHHELNIELFTLAKTRVTVATLLSAVLIVLATLWTSRLSQRTAERVFALRGVTSEGTIAVFKRLTHYLILAIGLSMALSTLGVDLGALFAAGAIFAIGLGFAMQNIAQNFVSGLILLIERTIKPGDVLELQGDVVKVQKMGIRATIVRTLEDEDLLVPNSLLVQNPVKNFTLTDSSYRLHIKVGVSYDSDLRTVFATLRQTAEGLSWRSSAHKVLVQLSDFGSSSVDFMVFVWIVDPWMLREYGSRLREAVWWALKDAGVTIAYPQLDLHLDREVAASLARIAPRSR